MKDFLLKCLSSCKAFMRKCLSGTKAFFRRLCGIKAVFKDISDTARLYPAAFASLLFCLAFGLTNAVISTVQLSLYIGITAAYSLILGGAKLYGLQKMKALKAEPDADVLRKTEAAAAHNIAVCASVMSFLYFSFAIVSTFFHEENPRVYGKWMLYFVVGSAFVKIILAAVQSLRTRKNRGLILHHIKLSATALALIALGLAQRTVLYYVGYAYAKTVSGIGGVFFSLCAAAVCLGMFHKVKTVKLQPGDKVMHGERGDEVIR